MRKEESRDEHVSEGEGSKDHVSCHEMIPCGILDRKETDQCQNSLKE